MVYLRWDKPKRTRSKEEHAEISFEDGPKGGYVPNMSEDDANAWKAKITGTKLGYPQVEIRKQAGSALMLIIVNLGDGYNYKSNCSGPAEEPDDYHRERFPTSDFWALHRNHNATWGKAMHFSMNGGAQLTTEEAIQLPMIIEEAKFALNQLVAVPGERHHYCAHLDPDTDTTRLKKSIEELGGKVTIDRPQYNVLFFTAPLQLIEPIWKSSKSIRAIYRAEPVQKVSSDIDDYRSTKEQIRERFEDAMSKAGPEGPGHPLIRRGSKELLEQLQATQV